MKYYTIHMIKYILHGGNTGEVNKDNNNFFKEMTSGLKGNVKILLNYFARKDSEIEKLAKQDKQRLLKHSKNKNLQFQVAQVERFEKQLKWANVMYMRGGIIIHLIKKLKNIKNIEKLFRDKVIAGSSAGAYALSKYYWGNNTKRLGKGLGILNIKCYCHCGPKDMKIIKKLMGYKKKLPLILLPNNKMMVIYK